MQLQRAVRDSGTRVRAGSWSAAQCGLAAAGAWAFATEVLGHTRPFFASVAAVVALGVGGGGRLRRTAELAAGVALGVAVGDLWVAVFGQGTWQIGVVVFLALVAAVAINGGGLAVTQAAVQAVFVVALPRTPLSGLHRWQDALVGGAAALLVVALLPANPWKAAQRLRCTYVDELAAVLRAAAHGVRQSAEGELAEALGRARALEPLLTTWEAALTSGRETTRLSPFRRSRSRGGDTFESGLVLVQGITRATRNLRVMLRRVLVATETGRVLPTRLPELLDQLAEAVARAGAADDALEPLLEVAAQLDPVALGATSLPSQVVVGQLRVAVIDLLDGLGLDHDQARGALPVLQP